MLNLIVIEAGLLVLPRLCERAQIKIREQQAAAMETMGLEGPLIGFEPLAPPVPAKAPAKAKVKAKAKPKVLSQQHKDNISKGRQANQAKKNARWVGPPKSLQDIGAEPEGARSLAEALDGPLHTPAS